MKGRPPRPRSPQEKKALSHAKDRRTCWGESPHGARIAIPANKAAEHRKSRHGVAQDLKVIDRLEEVAAEVRESSARQNMRRLGGWRKMPDQPLADRLRTQRLLRVQRAHRRQGQEAGPTTEG